VTTSIEELGDLEFYMEGLRQGLGITREDTLKANIAKLSKRYASGKYSNQQAHEHADKQPELPLEVNHGDQVTVDQVRSMTRGDQA
jgi:hypothetical protein